MQELLNIQSNLIATKDLKNTFGGYFYRSTESILTALKPLLLENQCTINITDDVVSVGGRNYIKATATLKNASGDIETTTAFAREDESQKGMQSAQITGSASSYARKYALNGLFAIDDTKDPDATNDHSDKKEVSVTKPVTKPEVKASTQAVSKKDWLNPGTKNWDAAVKRLKGGGDATIIGGTMGGVSIEKIEEFFMLSAENKDKLINEGRINEGK